MANPAKEAEQKAAHKLDIAFIIIGIAVILGCGYLFGRGAAEHLRYLTADEKLRVTAQFVEAKNSRSKAKMVDADGSISFDEVFDVVYQYRIEDQTYTFVRENEPTYNEKDIELRLFRSGSEEFRQTDMYGMWAGMHWFLLLLSLYIGVKLILSGAKSLRKEKNETEKPAA